MVDYTPGKQVTATIPLGMNDSAMVDGTVLSADEHSVTFLVQVSRELLDMWDVK